MKNHCFPALFVSLFAGMTAQADVVYTNAVDSSSFVSISNSTSSRGQTFTNTGPTAKIQSVTVYLRNSSGATGTLKALIRNITGTPGSSAVVSGTAIATSDSVTVTGNFTSLSAVTFSFTTQGNDLTANTSYAFAINAVSLTGTIDLYYGSQLSDQNSIVLSTSPPSADPTNDLAGQVVTVPEPGTLALGGIAAALGGLLCLWKKWPVVLARPAAV